MNVHGLNMKREDIVRALASPNFDGYYEEADRIRRKIKGEEVFLRAIIEYSSICTRDCLYCGLRKSNIKAERYRMSVEEIVETAAEAIGVGYKTIVLQGGEDPWFVENGLLVEAVREIKSEYPNIAITMSSGEIEYDQLEDLKNAGADRYLLKHETADPRLYERLHAGYSLDQRRQLLKQIKSLGFETGSGFMVGLPGQSVESLADDLLLLKEIPCDMAGIGPYISHPDTPLAGSEAGSPDMTRRCLAIARILLPHANLPVTTALGVISQEAVSPAFSGGANVIMRKVNSERYLKAYEIYPGRETSLSVKEERMRLEEFVRGMGRKPI